MKKKCITTLVLTTTLASQLAQAFAAGSASSGGSDGNGSISSSSSSGNGGTTNSKSSTTISVSSTGVKTTDTTTSAGPTGSAIGVVVDTVTTARQQITTNSKGEAAIGDAAVAFADSIAATTGFPSNVVPTISDTNAGKPLNEAVQGVNLTDYNALIGTHAIITKGAATGTVKTGAVEVSLYMPNLISNANNIQALFYDSATDQQQLTPAVKVDPVTETVAINVPGSGILSVVYKN